MAIHDNPAPASQDRSIQDHRQKPQGVIPRQLQMWLMIGIALVILIIIVVTGHPTPASRPPIADRATLATLPPTDRIRGYEQQLTQQVERQQQVLAQEDAQAHATRRTSDTESAPTDPLAEDQRRRAYQSLFADSVAFSRRATSQQPNGEHGPQQTPQAITAPGLPSPDARLHPALNETAAPNGTDTTATSNGVALQTASTGGSATPAHAADTSSTRGDNPATGPRLRLLEGTVIETVLLNRLDGAFSGPVNGLVTTPVYSQDRQHVLIPAGARVLGTAAPVQAWGDSRLAVSFHRLLMPDGHTYSLDVFKGLDQIGETGLRDNVNRHYLQVFGASLAIGALSGLAQYNTRGGFETSSVSDAERQAAGASLATSTSRVLDRYLNVLPTITIAEGYRIKVYLTNDLDLPAYSSVDATGGVR